MKGAFQLGPRLFRRRPRLQAAHKPQPPDAGPVHIRAFAVYIQVRFPGNWNCHVLRRSGLHRTFKTWRRDADDRERDIVEIDLFADDRRIAVEALLPVAKTQHCGCAGPSLVVFFSQHASEQRLNTQTSIIVA